ncbi:UBQ [Nesidiocoris tenuis]|uniref:UBQ n=1 Tax=Nesidiocoris tenuis TaxID=355587 RepID=A0ABN7BF80_9HEMI|nr:UBQ [Nesidiocoris tenuis]
MEAEHGKPDSNGETLQKEEVCRDIVEQPAKSPYPQTEESPKSPLPEASNEQPSGETDGKEAPRSPILPSPDPVSEQPKENISFIVIHSKTKYDVEFPLNDTVEQLKLHLQTLTGVPQKLQKVMYKGGLAKDEKSLKEIGVVTGAKLMLVGSKMDEVMTVLSSTSNLTAAEEKPSSSSKTPFCKQKNHMKVLEKGPPDDVMPGILYSKEPLPPCPLSGMLNKSGGKVRLTFKLELDQLWIGTKERTDKVAMASIKSIVSEPIEGKEQYHIMGIQLGTTDASRYWVYWVPAQYIDSIKEAVLGPWES